MSVLHDRAGYDLSNREVRERMIMAMSVKRCESIAEIVDQALSIISTEQELNPEDGAEFFFRGEARNFHHPGDPHAPSAQAPPKKP